MNPIAARSFHKLPNCLLTATDTDAGKTYIACEILKSWQDQGLSVGAYKPIASGAIWQKGQLVSEDALRLAAVTGQDTTEINPYTFEKPASPHIADVEAAFDLASCVAQYHQLEKQYDRVLVEGVGGWCVPLSADWMLNDLAAALNIPVVMVSRIGLGCINHSLLTVHQIINDGQRFHGWIANLIDKEYEDAKANISSIAARIHHKS